MQEKNTEIVFQWDWQICKIVWQLLIILGSLGIFLVYVFIKRIFSNVKIKSLVYFICNYFKAWVNCRFNWTTICKTAKLNISIHKTPLIHQSFIDQCLSGYFFQNNNVKYISFIIVSHSTLRILLHEDHDIPNIIFKMMKFSFNNRLHRFQLLQE